MGNLHIIREIANQKGIKLKWLVKEVGITEQGLQLIINSGKGKHSTLEKIANVLEIPLSLLIHESDENGNILEEMPKYYKHTRSLNDINEIDFLKQQLKEKTRMIELLEEEIKRLKNS